MQKPNQDQEDYAEAWDEPEIKPEDKPDEFEQKGEAEEKSLADQLAAGEGEKVAENKAASLFGVNPTKGLSRQTLAWEARGETDPDRPAPVAAHNNPGKDDALSVAVKSRNFDSGFESNVKKLMARGMTRTAAEQLQNQSRPK